MKEGKLEIKSLDEVRQLARIADALEEIAKQMKTRPVPIGLPIGRTKGFDGQDGVVFSGFGCTCGNPTTTTGGCTIHGVGPL